LPKLTGIHVEVEIADQPDGGGSFPEERCCRTKIPLAETSGYALSCSVPQMIDMFVQSNSWATSTEL